jgi:drug/metabolite transporter (DMT)-like permease
MTAYVIPIVAGVGGALFLGETITPFMFVGMGIIIAGITIINWKSKRQKWEIGGGKGGI